MKIRSIKISKQLDKSLYDYAQAKGLSGSAVVREALGEYLAGASQRSKSEPLSVAAFAADLAGCASGPADLSTGAAHMEGYGRSRAPKLTPRSKP